MIHHKFSQTRLAYQYPSTSYRGTRNLSFKLHKSQSIRCKNTSSPIKDPQITQIHTTKPHDQTLVLKRKRPQKLQIRFKTLPTLHVERPSPT